MQLGLDFSKNRGWGGKREGAGRKKTCKKPGKVSHAKRRHKKAHPVLVTTKVMANVPNLRGHKLGRLIGRYFRRVLGRHEDFRITAFSIQSNHLHLLVEAEDASALSRGLQGFFSGLAQVVNARLDRRGRLLRDRFHAHELTTPTETRHALRYVLMNHAKHGGPLGLDPLSSATWFAGWREVDAAPTGSPVAPPQTWLLREGWFNRGGLLSLRERPSSR